MIKPVNVVGRNLDETWFLLLKEIYKNGRITPIDTGSFAGSKRLQFDNASGTIMNPTERPLAPIVPEGVPVPTTDEKIEEYFANYIMDGKNLEKNEHYRYATFINGGEYCLPKADLYYGERFRCKTDTNMNIVMNVPSQVEWIVKHFKEKGYGNNHCFITVGYPESNFAYDIPYKNEAERQTSPCLRGIDFSIVNDNDEYYLNSNVIFRSWDLYSAFPENMGGITMLMEYVCEMIGDVKPGSLSFSSAKLHCYDYQIDSMKARIGVNE